MTILLLLAGGLVALYFGAEWLVRGSSTLALRFGVAPLVVGLTVVAYGTSTPELVVSVVGALNHQSGIALGNVVGSNIFNVAAILGLTALVAPLRVQFRLLRFDIPVMIGVTLLFWLLFRDRHIGRIEAGLFLLILIVYTVLNVRLGRAQATPETEQEFAEGIPNRPGPVWVDVGLILVGLGMLVLGSRLFVSGATDLARRFGLSEEVIGLTIVAAGTSLPELAASIVAAIRKQADIAIGNIVGSNIHNILAIVGVAGLLAPPLNGPGITTVDLATMTVITAVLLPIARSGSQITRVEGGLLLLCYGGYLAWLWPK